MPTAGCCRRHCGGAEGFHVHCHAPPSRVMTREMIATVLKLIARRLLVAIPILLIVSALLFCVLRLLPVDPAAMSLPPNATIEEVEAKRQDMGLDKPLPQQY